MFVQTNTNENRKTSPKVLNIQKGNSKFEFQTSLTILELLAGACEESRKIFSQQILGFYPIRGCLKLVTIPVVTV